MKTAEIKKAKNLYKDWSGMDLNIEEITEEKFIKTVDFTRRMLIDEVNQNADELIKSVFRKKVKI